MADWKTSLERLQRACANPREQLDRYLEQGKQVVGCFAPYAPEELELGRYILSGGSPLLAGYLGQKLAQLQAVMEGKRRGSADTAAEETLAGALRRRLRQIREEQV